MSTQFGILTSEHLLTLTEKRVFILLGHRNVINKEKLHTIYNGGTPKTEESKGKP